MMKKNLVLLYLSYIRFFAKLQLGKIKPNIIAVGGSSGKTSTTNFIATCLSRKFVVKQSKGKNSETGIPLDILGIDLKEYDLRSWFKVLFLAPVKLLTNNKKYEIYVVEMGIDSPLPPKNMEYILKIVKPNLGVLTNIDIEHSEAFDSLVKADDESERKRQILDLISKEEGLLLKSINSDGRSILNIDDPNIKNLIPLRSKIVTVSARDKRADLYISKINVGLDGFQMNFIFLSEEYSLKLLKPLPEYFAYSFALAIAVCFSFGVSIKEAISTIEDNFSLPPGRFSVIEGIKNSIVIDSSYNSSLMPAIGALEAVSAMGGDRRKVGILGDMRELGSLSKIQHEQLAKTIVKTLDEAILIGPQMQKYVSPVLAKNGFKYVSFENFSNAKERILSLIKENDLILVKGSQNTLFLERAVEMLLMNKEDKELLCRRGKFWDNLRRNTP